MPRALFLAAAFLLTTVATAGGAAPAAPAPPGRFVLVYVSGGLERLAQSRDGVRWTGVAGIAARSGERPSAVRRGQRLYVFDILRVEEAAIVGELRRFRVTGSTFSELPPATIRIDLASPEDAQRSSQVSGSFALDTGGQLTALYALRLDPETNACPVAGQACVKVRTATEVSGSDGALFRGDPGNRIVISLEPTETVRDPSALVLAKGFGVLLAGPGACLRLLTAPDLHGQYSSVPSLPGGCAAALSAATPSGAYRPQLGEHWLYVVSGGRAVRAVTRSLGKQVPARRFRPLRLPEMGAVTSASFALNSSQP